MHVSYKYKLLLTTNQVDLAKQIAGSTRWLWNHMLSANQTKYQAEKKFIFAYNMHKLIPALKAQHDWLKLAPSQSLQQKCVDLDRALTAVWKSDFRFPKFKSKHRSQDSFRVPQTNGHIKISDIHITIPKLGQVKWVYHRPIIGNVKSITVTRDCDNWFVSVCCEIPDVTPITEVDRTKTIGIDLGVSSFATMSDGSKIESPTFLKKKLQKLKKYQRRLRNKQKGSKNKAKQYAKIAKIHQQIRNQRNDWLHKQSSALVEKYDVICVEDLKIQELLKKKQMSRSIADQGWGIFVNQLQYKTKLRGKHLSKIGTYMPSTKACSCCGHTKIMKLSSRVYVCENTQCTNYLKTKDRDVNAAINIHVWGLMGTTNINLYTPGTGGIDACGDTLTSPSNQDWVSTKQEAAYPLGSQ